jgi:hypothetical protein
MIQLYSTYWQQKWSDNASSDISSQPITCTVNQFIQASTNCLWVVQVLKMEETCSSKMLVDFQWTTQPYIPGNRTLFMIYQQWAAVVRSSSRFGLSFSLVISVLSWCGILYNNVLFCMTLTLNTDLLESVAKNFNINFVMKEFLGD